MPIFLLNASAQLLAPGMQQFADANGVPFVNGQVFMYVPPATTTFKDTWIDRDELVLNQNPVLLDAAGRAVIFGQGQYRQVLKDQFANTIWDKQVEYAAAPATPATLYDLASFLQGKPSNSEVYPIWNAPRALKLPAGLTASQFTISTLPTANMVFTLARNGSSIGTVTFAPSGVPTVVFLADVTFNSADQLTVAAQAVADATGGNVAMTFVFTAL
jgi:hypothetical protein